MIVSPILVLGIGNTLLGDDGVGPAAIAELASRYRFPPSVRLLEGATAGLRLLPEILDAEKLLVLDAVQGNATPGAVVVLDGQSLPSNYGKTMSPHEIGVADLMKAARLHGGPREIVVLGVEPESVTVRVGLSDRVAAALPTLIDAVLGQLRDWGAFAEGQGIDFAWVRDFTGQCP